MAISFVQVQNNESTSGSSLASLTVNITTTAGNFLVCGAKESTNNTDTIAISDNASGGSNTWTQTSSGYTSASSGNRGGLWYVANSKAVTSVTMTPSASAVRPALIVMEFSGLVASSPQDTSVNSSNGSLVTSLTSGTYTTTNANDLLIYYVFNGANQTSWTAGSGFTIPSNNNTTGASGSDARTAMQYNIVSAIQSSTTTSMSWGTASVCASVFGAFKALSGGVTILYSVPLLGAGPA